jgi:gamma-glutamyltranspeptidase/glutathione hydrolase
VPVTQLLDPGYLKARAAEIPLQQGRSQAQVQPATATQLGWAEKTGAPNTSHLTVVDGDRTVVSLTFTINTRFGSGVTVPGTGILLNNEMDDFSAAPDARNSFGLVGLTRANRPEGGKTPLSSMTPFILRENGQPRLAGGSPGGSTIISTVLQLILNRTVYGFDVGAAVAAARLHHQWVPDQLRLEHYGFDPLTVSALASYGYRVREDQPWGNANLLAIAPDGQLSGAADPRGEGIALGLD